MNNFARENNLQCYRNLCRPTLRKRITSVILAHSGQKTFFSKITYTMLCLSGCCVYQTNTTLHRNIAYSFCPNTSERTLHKRITDAMLCQTTQSSFRRKITICNVVLICLSRHCIRKIPLQCWPILHKQL